MNEYLSKALECNTESGYLRYHAPRYEILLSILHKYYKGDNTVLDIGCSPFTAIASGSLKANIDTLGFEPDKETDTGVNYNFDLNNAQHSEMWRRDIPKYDIIIFSEVIEHVHTSPELVLKFLKSLLKETGLIILQTPNAVVMHKRIKMLLGRNPFGLISVDIYNPGHFREYTSSEIADYCTGAGFDIERMTCENYFDYRFSRR